MYRVHNVYVSHRFQTHTGKAEERKTIPSCLYQQSTFDTVPLHAEEVGVSTGRLVGRTRPRRNEANAVTSTGDRPRARPPRSAPAARAARELGHGTSRPGLHLVRLLRGGRSTGGDGARSKQTWTFKGCSVWRSLSSVGASIGDPFEGAGTSKNGAARKKKLLARNSWHRNSNRSRSDATNRGLLAVRTEQEASHAL